MQIQESKKVIKSVFLRTTRLIVYMPHSSLCMVTVHIIYYNGDIVVDI